MIRITMLLVACALLFGALAPQAANAQSADTNGKIISGSIPSDGGYGIIVYGGGTYEQLVAASGCPVSRVVFWVIVSGEFVTYIPASAVAAPNAGFAAAFPNSTIPPNTPFIGKCTPVAASGIEGTVTLGPVCPVQNTTQACPDRPYQGATLVIYNALVACPAFTCGEVARTTTDSNGRYRVTLAAGTYTIVPQPAGTGVFPRPPSPVTLTVTSGTYATANFTYDTGIRSAQ